MNGVRHYTFEIATRTHDGQWTVLTTQSGTFTRGAKATARSIAERWIIGQARRLPGGRLVVLGRRGEPRRTADAMVRILILKNGSRRRLAAAYVVSDARRKDLRAHGNLPAGL
jgi:hypothetical protein